MKKRLNIIALLLAVAVGVGAVVYWALTPTPGVTVENFRRLNYGMTEAEVEAILGGCSDVQRDKSRAKIVRSWIDPKCTIRLGFAFVMGDYGVKTVLWDGECVTDSGQTLQVGPKPPPYLERLRGWLGI